MTKMPDMTADELERRFDAGEDMSAYFDWDSLERPNLGTKRVALELPVSVVEDLDRQARELGVTRHALITRWVTEHAR